MAKIKSSFFILLIILLNLFLQLFPHYYAYLKTPVNQVFSGQASWFDPWDINVYVAAVGFGQTGQILLENLYTTAQQPPALIYPLYTIFGFIFRTTDPWLVFYSLTVITATILIITIYWSSKVFLKEKNNSILATLLITIAGGFGWLAFASGFNSGDTSITGFTFFSAFGRPHEALGLSLYIFILTNIYLFIEKKTSLRSKLYIIFGLCLLVIFYPYYLLSLMMIATVYFLVMRLPKSRWIEWCGIAALPVLITCFYFFHLQKTSFVTVVSQQLSNVDPMAFVLGYGALLPIFFYISTKYRQERIVQYLTLWFFVSLLLSQLPLGFARFYLRTLFLPLIIQLFFLLGIWKDKKVYLLNLFLPSLLILISLTSVYIFVRRIQAAFQNNPWFYQTKDTRVGLNFLKDQKNGGVLSGYYIGNLIPALMSNKRVYFGHLIQTPEASDKMQHLKDFYAGLLDDKQASIFLSQNNIVWIVYGPEEKKLGKLPSYQFLESKFSNQDIDIFHFQK